MSTRLNAVLATVAMAAAVAWLTPASVDGQAPGGAAKTTTFKVPRTSWGEPDLQGVWRNDTPTPMERPAKFGTRELLTDEELAAETKAAFENRAKVERGDVDAPREGDVGTYNRFWQDPGRPPRMYNRTSLIVDPPDGRIPYTAEGQLMEDRATARYGKGPWNSYLDIDTGERCLSDGLTTTMFRDTAGGFKEIIQSPGYVLIQQEQFRDRRIIRLDNQPRRTAIPQWYGQSRGRWEGDTLVVETAQFIDRPDWEWNNIYQRPTDTLRLVERWTRVDPETIEYRMTVEDPKTFTRPWSVLVPLSKTSNTTRLYEYACHEGSYSVENTLAVARDGEAASASQKPAK